MAIEPRYTYDPVTRTYTRIDTPVESTNQGLGSLYNAGDGGDGISPSGPGNAFTDAFGHPTEMGVSFGVGAQNLGNALAPVSTFSPTLGVVGQVASNIGNSIMGTKVSPVANPVAPTETAISPTASLAAMNAQTAAKNQTAVGPTGVNAVDAAVAQAVADFADTTDAEAAATVGTPDSGTTSGSGGPSGDAGVSGAADEGSHAADGNDSGAGATGGPSGDPSDAGDSDDSSYYRGGRVMNYAQGGIADAVKTQSMGRGPDTMLVHMSPKEVQGLQALAMAHGGSLTINPKTGLPEAGFLDSILPVVAGAALTVASGGTLTPLMAAGIVGGGTALFTGDLGKGFMAGLGAFGGAGLGAGLAGAGASTTAGQVMTPAAANATQVVAQPVASTATASLAPESLKATLINQGTLMPQTVTPAMNQAIGQQAAQSAVQQAAAAPTLSNMSAGIQNLATGQPGAGANFMNAVGGTPGLLKYGGAAASATMGGMEEEPGEFKKQQTYIRPYKFDAGRQADKEGFKYRTGAPGESSSELTYFRPSYTAQPVQKYEDYMTQNMAGGGIAAMAKGRYLKGGGDGMSDDIPATIEGGQPARLADGEFVVPADVVSHLGNGSSNAGAKKLYKMMDRIRTARTGKKHQAPEVKTEKYMPA